MKPQISPLKADLLLHALLLAAQLLLLIPGGFLQKGTTPPWVYPAWMILSTVTLYRVSEVIAEYRTRRILVPAILSCVLYGLCLINEMTRDLWAFAQPRHFPVYVRILWYQTGLFLLHPRIYKRVDLLARNGFHFLRERGYFGPHIWVIALIAAIFMWFLRSQNISPDGYDWLEHSAYTGHWVRYLREPFGTFLFFLFVQFGAKVFHWAPYISITVLNILCGIAATLFLRRVFRYAVPEPFSGAALLLLLCSYGYAQVFVGNIEIYALLQTGLSIFLYAVVRYLEDEWPVWIPGFIFGALICLHLSTGWWLPVFLAVPFLKLQSGGSIGSPLRASGALIAGFWGFAIPFGLFVWLYGYGGDFKAMWDHFWGPQVMNVGADGAMFRSFSAFINFDVYLAMFNEYCCMIPGGILLLFAIAASRFRVSPWTPFCQWTGLMTALYLLYSVVWNPDRHFPADWDLFSALTIPAILLIAQWMARLPLRRETIFYLYYQATVFSGLYLLIQLIRNHVRITEWPMDM